MLSYCDAYFQHHTISFLSNSILGMPVQPPISSASLSFLLFDKIHFPDLCFRIKPLKIFLPPVRFVFSVCSTDILLPFIVTLHSTFAILPPNSAKYIS